MKKLLLTISVLPVALQASMVEMPQDILNLNPHHGLGHSFSFKAPNDTRFLSDMDEAIRRSMVTHQIEQDHRMALRLAEEEDLNHALKLSQESFDFEMALRLQAEEIAGALGALQVNETKTAPKTVETPSVEMKVESEKGENPRSVLLSAIEKGTTLKKVTAGELTQANAENSLLAEIRRGKTLNKVMPVEITKANGQNSLLADIRRGKTLNKVEAGELTRERLATLETNKHLEAVRKGVSLKPVAQEETKETVAPKKKNFMFVARLSDASNPENAKVAETHTKAGGFLSSINKGGFQLKKTGNRAFEEEVQSNAEKQKEIDVLHAQQRLELAQAQEARIVMAHLEETKKNEAIRNAQKNAEEQRQIALEAHKNKENVMVNGETLMDQIHKGFALKKVVPTVKKQAVRGSDHDEAKAAILALRHAMVDTEESEDDDFWND